MGIAWHAPYEILKPETRDMARATLSPPARTEY